MVAAVVVALPSTIMSLIQQAIAATTARPAPHSTLGHLTSPVFSGVSSAVHLVLQAFVLGGAVTWALSAARGRKLDLGQVFRGGPYFGTMLAAGLLHWVASMIGFALCIVPGIVIGIGLSLYAYCVVDQKLSAVDALKTSWELTRGHKMNLFLLALIVVGIVLAGLLACCVGSLVAVPIGALATSYAYLRIRGETPQLPA
jgi:uncharacterized membrane protein